MPYNIASFGIDNAYKRTGVSAFWSGKGYGNHSLLIYII